MGTRGVLVIAGALSVAMFIAGCGGGDSSSDSTISKAVFIKKADAICKASIERIETSFISYLRKSGGGTHPGKAAEEELVGKVLVPSVQREVKELRALGAPSGDEDRVDAIVEALEEGAETAESDPAAVTSSSEVVFGIASRLAKEYGLEACGSR
ncbi:MAG TPA: hypothetical protein VHU14_00645 [Solirubrobacterales bacterium]|jgi:hypothetical protein|nr:hypothetical protein [Solirubrobacterales bacterium]